MKNCIVALSIFVTLVLIVPTWISINDVTQQNMQASVITVDGNPVVTASIFPADVGRTRP